MKIIGERETQKKERHKKITTGEGSYSESMRAK